MVVPAIREWAAQMVALRPEVAAIGYFGSYARGNYGVGSDLDVVVLLESTDEPFERRGIHFPTTGLPVPVDLLIYTAAEFDAMQDWSGFARTIAREAVWVYRR